MTDTPVAAPEAPAVASDIDDDVTHLVCCVDSDGPTLCGAPIPTGTPLVADADDMCSSCAVFLAAVPDGPMRCMFGRDLVCDAT